MRRSSVRRGAKWLFSVINRACPTLKMGPAREFLESGDEPVLPV